MSGLLMPVARGQYFDGDGHPLAGGKLYFFMAGTSTPIATYADDALMVPNENPVILDASGRAGPIYWHRGAAYKLVVTDADDVPIPGLSGDNLALPPDVAPVLPDSMPTGAVLSFAGAVAPTGYLLCNGAAVDRIAYAALFAVIGTTFGAGDGTGTFNVPDLQGRAPIGAGQGAGLTNRVLGASAGAETHQLAANQMPQHNHGVTDPGHQHQVEYEPWGVTNGANGPAARLSGGGSTKTSTAVPTGITTQNAGGNVAHNNMQPSLALHFIIKT